MTAWRYVWRNIGLVAAVGIVLFFGSPVAAEVTSVPSSISPKKLGAPALSQRDIQAKQLEARTTRVLRNQLDKAKVLPKGSRAEDDYFVVGKGEMPVGSQSAAADFVVIQGVEESLQQVVDYLRSTPSQTIRDYVICARFKSAEVAEQSLGGFRQQYVALQARQQEMRRQYAIQASQRYQAELQSRFAAPSAGRC